MFNESFSLKLAITCNTTAAIWLLIRFLNKWIWKTDLFYFSYKHNERGKWFHIWKRHMTTIKNGKNLFIWKCHLTSTRKGAYVCNKLQLQSHSSTFIGTNESFLSATSIPSSSPIVYNTTASLDKLSCTNSVKFGKGQYKFERLFSPKIIPTNWMWNSKFSRKTTGKNSDWYKIWQ